jgi:Phage gp6-like head-tail connector protein
MALVTLEDAKRHLQVTDPAFDADITVKLEEAEIAILNYLKDQADPDWTETTVPRPVQAGIKKLLTHLWRERGDDEETTEKLWTDLDLLLVRYRDPALR